MNVLQRTHLPPSGVEYAVSLQLTQSSSRKPPRHVQDVRPGRPVADLVVAKATFIQVFEVREVEVASTSATKVEDGASGKTVYKLFHLREHRLHGVVTGLQRVETLETAEDGMDRLLISFKDAKMTLMEWSAALFDLVPISLHTFEKLPQITQGDILSWRPTLVVDPQSRCAALLLPQSTLAVLPFTQDQLDFSDLGFADADDPLESAQQQQMKSLPYGSSFALDLPAQVSSKIRHIVAVDFLPGFSEPTLAVLYHRTPTWAGRLENAIDTASLAIITLDLVTTHHPIIAEADNLPSDSHSLIPCPPALGGVVVLCGDMVLHIDQSGKMVGVATNGWPDQTSGLRVPRQDRIAPHGRPEESFPLIERLDNSRLLFTDDDLALLFLADGATLALRFERDGRTLVRLKLEHLARVSPASTAVRVGDRGVFAASNVGDSALLELRGRLDYGKGTNGVAKVEAIDAMQLDDDLDDLYGETTKTTKADKGTATNGTAAPVEDQGPFRLETADVFKAYGPIRGMTIAHAGDGGRPEVLGCTGAGDLGGLTLFHRYMPKSKRRQLPVEAAEQIFAATVSGTTYLWTSTDSTTNVYSEDDWKLLSTESGSTVMVGSILDGTEAVRVTPNSIRLLDSNLQEVQRIEPETPTSIVRAYVVSPYVLVERRDRTPLLYRADHDTAKLQKVILPEELAVVSSTLFSAALPRFVESLPEPISKAQAIAQPEDDEDDLYGSPAKKRKLSPSLGQTPQQILAPVTQEVYISVINDKGDLNVLSLPELNLVYSAPSVDRLPEVLQRFDEPEAPAFGDLDEESATRQVEQHRLFQAGGAHPTTHLTVILESGALATYRCTADLETANAGQPGQLACSFIKLAARNLEPSPTEEDGPGSFERALVPYADPSHGSGAFLTGSTPLWLTASDAGPLRIYEDDNSSANGFVGLKETFAISSSGIEVFHLARRACIDKEVPTSAVKVGRSYSFAIEDPPTQSIVASSYHEASFANFDEEGEGTWDTSNETIARPTTFRSALELIVPGSWSTVHGYEFQTNEGVTSLKSIQLVSASTAPGLRHFVAVGTTTNRAEDLSSKGGLYVFEVVRTLPDPEHPERDRILVLRYYEETKACVSNVDGVGSGYFIHTMGQKLYAKSFEQDERLLAVGFLDIRPHTTCFRVFKNFVLLGDAAKGVTLVAFQETPFKLIELGHTHVDIDCSSVDFAAIDGKLAIIVSDMNGTIRILEYNPTNIESQGGQKLLVRTEYQNSSEVSFSLPFGKRSSTKGDASVLCTLYASHDGSIHSLVPAKELVFKRLQLVQTRLVRRIPQFGGLNPRGYRTVRNETVSRAINRGILDGDLLGRFEMLSVDQQEEAARLVSSDRETVLYNLENLRGLW